jgi:hypothetical protein
MLFDEDNPCGGNEFVEPDTTLPVKDEPDFEIVWVDDEAESVPTPVVSEERHRIRHLAVGEANRDCGAFVRK